MFRQRRLRHLKSQLIFTFLFAFLGIGLAIGLPAILLISRQASSQAQLLLDQAVVASRAFLEREQSDLQSLALVISQRPTLTRLLAEQNFSALESYLNTLQEGANLDLILICSNGEGISDLEDNVAANELCQADSQTGYAAFSSGEPLYLYATADVTSDQQSLHKVIVGKSAASTLSELQEETRLLYFLVWGDQTAQSSDSSIKITPDLAARLMTGTNQDVDLSLQQRSFPINEHQYLLSNVEIEPTLGINLISALNVDNQIAVQQGLISSLMFGLFFIV